MKKSKAVKQGDLVTLRGDKLIRYGGKGRLLGVYQEPKGFWMSIGKERKNIQIPEGVVFQGMTECKIGKKSK